jgi:hypothetical protein
MIAIFSLAQESVAIAEKVKRVLLAEGFDAELICSELISCEGGVVVRAIEPKKKTEDPWVVCIDENGKWVIPVLNGHRGANKFSKLIATGISARAVITTLEEFHPTSP